MSQRLSPGFLRLLRNRIPIDTLITSTLKIPFKHSEEHLRFLCPLCGDFHTATNPGTNLARCFRCQRNFNPIDMVMTINSCSFIEAVRFLEPLLSDSHASSLINNPENNIAPKDTSIILSGVGSKIKEAGSGGVTNPPHRTIS